MANKMSPSGKADLQFLLNCIYFSPELKLVHEPVANALRDTSKADGTACMFLFEQYGPDPWWQADVNLLYQMSLKKLRVIISTKGFSVRILALRTTCAFFVTLLILGDFLFFTVVTDWFPPLVFEPEIMHQLRGHFTVLNPNPDDLAIIEDNGKISKDTLPSFDPQIRTKIPSSHPPSAEKRKLASIGTRQHPARI